ncbi:hypothetical protein [Paracoccus sediminicola]|uniref:hypothetical protein n=1 Tax=Paracoccus sediminicola TaxID=3017783 RepID=UPI0022F0870F|nr:hypothetical protein [Paracoccus sediminicola]WBU56965.1 hypothetical protein PAF18_00525 [Paracoccus sediminicola]
MKIAFRLLLVVLMVMTSHSLAVARGQPRVAGQMAICAGGELVTVYVDENGEPVSRVVICPDMALNLMAAIESDAPEPLLRRSGLCLDPDVSMPAIAGRDAPRAHARAPPLAV